MPERAAPKRKKKGDEPKKATAGGLTDLLKTEKVGKTHHNKRLKPKDGEVYVIDPKTGHHVLKKKPKKRPPAPTFQDIELAPEDLISAAGFFGVIIILVVSTVVFSVNFLSHTAHFQALGEIGIGVHVYQNHSGEQHHGMRPGSWWGALFALPPAIMAVIMSYVLYDDEQRKVAVYATYLAGWSMVINGVVGTINDCRYQMNSEEGAQPSVEKYKFFMFISCILTGALGFLSFCLWATIGYFKILPELPEALAAMQKAERAEKRATRKSNRDARSGAKTAKAGDKAAKAEAKRKLKERMAGSKKKIGVEG
jgi:hypothetical protein